MLSQVDIISDGDWAIAYEGFNSLKVFQVKKGQSINNRNGMFKHDDMIGKKYGTAITSSSKIAGYMHVLRINPQLWTQALSVRTQILFQTDISMVLYHLDLKPGSVVIESGTGSGSLTTSMAQAVAPFGHIHTFEFNADRVEKAKIDFRNNGLEDVVTCRHRDVCARGFPYFPEGVDAIFLDLPTPWETIESCHRNLRPQGRICSFSPCIEQVQKFTRGINQLKYEDVFTIECLLKPFDVIPNRSRMINLDELTNEYDNNMLKYTTSKTKGDMSDASAEPVGDVDLVEQQDTKKPKVEDTPANAATVKLAPPVQPIPLLLKPETMRGHTGYLTFARKPASVPADLVNSDDEEEEETTKADTTTTEETTTTTSPPTDA